MGFKAYNSGFAGKSYDSYQPDMYDPTIASRVNNADGDTGASTAYTTAAAKPGQKMQITISVVNLTAQELTAEFFFWLDSITKRLKPEFVKGTYLYIPEDSHEGLRRVVANTGGTVSWDQDGNLVIRGDDSAANPLMTIGCSEVCYRSLFEASAILPFQITFIRQTVTTQGQIDKKITWLKKTIAGGVKINPINPRAYFRPNQFQTLTLDLPLQLDIGVDSGLQMPVKVNETVTLNLFISFWTYQASID